MSTNAIDPSEWGALVDRLRDASDQDVKSRLAEREARFDNFFAYFEYSPEVAQSVARTALAVTSSTAKVIRIGSYITVHYLVAVNAAGTAGQSISLSTPAGLEISAGGLVSGTWEFKDANITTVYIGKPWALSGNYVFADTHGATAFTGFGVNPAITLAAGDILWGDFSYFTDATRLF